MAVEPSHTFATSKIKASGVNTLNGSLEEREIRTSLSYVGHGPEMVQ